MAKNGKILVALLVLTVLSCAPSPGSLVVPRSIGDLPVTIIVEREISGEIFRRPLTGPTGLARNFRGELFIADSGNDRIISFDSTFNPLHEIGGQGIQAGLMHNPVFIHIDNGLNLIVSEEGNRRLSRYDSDLNFTDLIEFFDFQDQNKFGYPSGLLVGEYGEIWAADREKNRLAVFDSFGRFDRFVGGFGYSGGQLLTPEKITRDQNRNIVVCDAGNKRIMTYDQFGNYVSRTNSDRFEYPVSVAVDGAELWVLDKASGEVLMVKQNGEILFATGPQLHGAEGRLSNPSDMILVGKDRLIIADTGNNRILVCRIVYESP